MPALLSFRVKAFPAPSQVEGKVDALGKGLISPLFLNSTVYITMAANLMVTYNDSDTQVVWMVQWVSGKETGDPSRRRLLRTCPLQQLPLLFPALDHTLPPRSLSKEAIPVIVPTGTLLRVKGDSINSYLGTEGIKWLF